MWALSAYHKAFGNQEYGYGAAISLLLIVVVALLMFVITIMPRRTKKEVTPNA